MNRHYTNQHRKRTCKIVDFAVPTDYRVKLKESEKKDKYLDLAREFKKLEQETLGTVAKGLIKGLENLEIS